jgi:DNA invertase Pin-like site-specific DNA recombinase
MTFDCYLRVSTHLDDATSTSAESQEAACRNIATVKGVTVGEVVYDAGVSGGKAVAERQLEHLIRRCEAGESGGIIVYEITRFGRDMAEGALAWKRLKVCGARLISADGVDSDAPGSGLHFNMLTAIADDFLERNRSGWDRSKRSAVARGVHIYPAPYGYRRVGGRLVVEPDEADVVRQAFRLRGAGMGFSEMSRKLGLGRTSLLKICSNRTYLGEIVVANRQRPGKPDVITGAHAPIVTVAEWEAANAVKKPPREATGLAKSMPFHGLVRCDECASRATAQGNGTGCVSYVTGCTKHSRRSIAMGLLDRAVRWQLDLAIATGEPHVAATIAGDHAFELALADVETALTELETYRRDVSVSLVGKDAWTADVEKRNADVAVARAALAEVRPPDADATRVGTLAEASDADTRAFYRRAIAEIVVRPAGTDGERIAVRWVGAEDLVECHPVPVSGAVPMAAAA